MKHHNPKPPASSQTKVTAYTAAELSLGTALARSLQDASNACVKTIDLEGNLLSMNAPGQILMEVDDFSSVEGNYWPNFWLGHNHARAKQAIHDAARGISSHFVGDAYTAKKTLKWWDVTVAPVTGEDGTVLQILSISRDITQQRQTEESLRQAQAPRSNRASLSPPI